MWALDEKKVADWVDIGNYMFEDNIWWEGELIKLGMIG